VEILSAADIHFRSVYGVIKYPVPKSLKLFKSVDISRSCDSVCSYEGNTYVGFQHSIVKINEDFTLTELVAIDESVKAVTVYKDKLYALTYSYLKSGSLEMFELPKVQYQLVRVYTLDGNQVTSWHHRDESESHNQLTVIDDQVVIPDRGNKRITVYSLAGEIEKHIHCSLLDKTSRISICAADRHCVVVSDACLQVFKLDLTTEKVIWTCKDVHTPRYVTCYRSGYILVTKESSKPTIGILDVKTG